MDLSIFARFSAILDTIDKDKILSKYGWCKLLSPIENASDTSVKKFFEICVEQFIFISVEESEISKDKTIVLYKLAKDKDSKIREYYESKYKTFFEDIDHYYRVSPF